MSAALETADWRRRTFALYAEVRAEAERDATSAHARWVAGRDEMFRTHPASALSPAEQATFTGLPVAPYDPAWRFELPLLPTEAAGWDYETGTDGIVHYDPLGAVEVPGVGRLEVWRHAGYGGGLFLPVRDAASDTYGGGRYLLDTIKGADLGFSTADGTLVIDLNFAYNPSCAYDPAWACPLAPPGNTVAVPIPVGERYAG